MRREISACVAKDAPCYGHMTVEVPDEVPVGKEAEWFLENAADLANDDGVVYEPEWSYMDGFRIIDAQLISDEGDEAELYSDTQYPEGLPDVDVAVEFKTLVAANADEIIKSNLRRELVIELLRIANSEVK